MSLLLAGAKRIESTAGLRAGLAAYRALAQRGPSLDSALAHLAALRCAAELDDDASFKALLSSWPSQPGQHAERATALAHRLAQNGKAALARILLEAERTRWSDAERNTQAATLSLYLAAALAHVEGRAELLKRLRASTRNEALAARADLRLAELLRARGKTAQAAEAARSVAREHLSPSERLRHASLLLLSGSRFQRAAGFGELAERVSDAEAEAIAMAVRGLCCRLPALTPLEIDRIRAVFTRIPDEARRETWSMFVDAVLARNESGAEAPAEAPPGAKGALDLQWLHVTLRDLVARLRDASEHERAPLERRFAELMAMGAVPASGFLPFTDVVADLDLRADLLLRAEAAAEPGARQALLAWIDACAEQRIREGDVEAAYRLAERALAAERSGDYAEVREIVGSPRLAGIPS